MNIAGAWFWCLSSLLLCVYICVCIIVSHGSKYIVNPLTSNFVYIHSSDQHIGSPILTQIVSHPCLWCVFFQQHVVSFSSMCTYTTVLPPSEHNDYLGYDYKQPTHWYLLQIFFISRSWKYLFHFLFDSLSQVSNSFIPSMIRKKNNDSISHNSNIISHSYSN